VARFAGAIVSMALAAAVPAQQIKPETARDFDCYVQAAEARLEARKPFLLADADAALHRHLVQGQRIQTMPANGQNPHKVAKGQIYDTIGTVFIPGATMERLLRMLQDYDRRAQYFSQIVSASKLLCRKGERFQVGMRMKEPAITDVTSEVLWERLDAHRWRSRSYSTEVKEIGKEHRYLLRLNSYWRFAEAEKGVFVETETISLSGEFSAMTRSLGAMVGISPEKSLKRSLENMRATLLKPGMEFPGPPAATSDCGEPFRPPGCAAPHTERRP
jgi:hypothetical protein